ncbi:pollen calcium-binding protein 1, EMBRYO DEFECTIVE 2771, anaphase promoting complex 1 [Hibiscus trionum]|uniref:Anaphase-promoting complex subunit 1 n=1 Tax=Hibiscus trionum TaxID=183268 RepID=A0A9W7M489_HIBTR|nr:pollen calcium-binding protein 1, EMBRYO DEFECTIVE 2771, anaphase promoting complex 1 [Hibiscus trionum]
MPVGVRQLTVLGEFKPFGLIAEALDGKPPDNSTDDYDYFLFDPVIARQRDDILDNDAFASALSDRRDHELFIRGNRIIWSVGSRIFKRFTLPSPVIKACWCRMGDNSEALLCVLLIDSITIYNTSGEVVSIPLPCSIISMWSLPFGLLLQQQVAEENSVMHGPFPYSSSSLGSHDIIRNRRESGHSPHHNFSFLTAYDPLIKGESSLLSSHLILKDLLEEPQSIYIEERGKLNIMRDFDERTIWTSDVIPLMASYNKVKMQHSVWVAEVINSSLEVEHASLSATIPAGVLPKRFCFRRIWQGKGAQTAASKVFLATDDDSAPVICFLFLEQKKLLSLRLQTVEINNEILYDVKPDMSWSIPAIAAAPVIVTQPSVKVGLLPYTDIIVLAPENILVLYSGKHCLCRFLLPSSLGKGSLSCNLGFSEAASISHDLKIVGLADAVEARINVKVNNRQIFRCALRRSPSSSLANDCITAMAEGLSPSFYNHFLILLWGDNESGYLSEANSTVDSEWSSFCDTIMQMCKKSSVVSQDIPKSSWEFLLDSKFHRNYCKINSLIGLSSDVALDRIGLDSMRSSIVGTRSSEKSFYSDLLGESLDSLHAVYESLKMDNLRRRDLELLAILLCDIAKFLGEECYLDHYIRDFPSLCKTFWMGTDCLSSKAPFSLFRWLENCLQRGCTPDNINNLPLVVCKDGSSVVSWARKIVSFYSLLCGAKIIGKKLSSGVSCNIASGSFCSNEEVTVLAMVGEKFGLKELDSLPSGVSLPLRHALDKCRESPPADWPAAAYVLLGREDLALSCLTRSCKFKELETQTNVNLVCMSTPYMLHLHPVTIPSTVSETDGLESTKLEDTDSIDGSTADGMENIFSSCTQLRYGRDLRLNEVRRLLCSARPVAIQTSVNPSASDQDLQQAQLWQLAQRTTALPLGRGAFTLATIYTLLTEAFNVPKLVLAGRLPAQQNATVNLDPSIRNIQELKSWPEFHNAVAAGLRLAPLQGKVSRTWIQYNKPEEPNAVHAGLLLALGLHGFLRVLRITDIYQYFSQEHESTTAGLMLGLAASYRGTMQPSIAKCLYVHIPAHHPSSYPELELPTLLQTAALMSLGLLFEGSAHPQTMQRLLSEIGRRSGGDNVLEREGYAVSAGFSLGLVALGRGEDTLGFMSTLVDRLFHYIGGKEIRNERSPLIATSVDEHNRGTGQMMDGTTVNVDVTAPGAMIALALMFLKSESEVIVSRLTIPQTHFDLQYVRPDFIMLRVIARNLIMWGRIHPSKDWIQSQIPDIVKNGVKGLGDDTMDIDEMDAETIVQAYVNIVAGACISLGLRFAGTKDGNAQELLYEYAVCFLNEIKLVSTTNRNTFPKGLSQYVDRGTLEICLHLIVLSLSVVMAGSGHLQTLRLLRFLRNRSSVDGHANYGIQMVVSLAIGFLFLGGGTRTFSTSNSSIAALLITLYPQLPTGPNDNRCHLQAFRHLYVLATEARWLQTVDVDTGLPVYAPLDVTIRETEHYSETSFCEITPCILPERSILKTVRVCGPRYWPQVIELVPENEPWWSFGDRSDPFHSGVLHVKRKVGACSYVDDPIGCQSLLSRAMHKVFGSTSLRAGKDGPTAVTVDQLVSTFSSDPSLIVFAQLFCDLSWNSRSDVDFQEFCLQVLFECISKDRPALLQVYLSLYTTIGTLAEQVSSSDFLVGDSLSLSSLKLALSYNEAVLSGRLTSSNGSIVQSVFLGSLRKRVEELLNCSEALKNDLRDYLNSGSWPDDGSSGVKSSTVLSWYLQWFGVPAPAMVKTTVDKIKPMNISLSPVPLLCLLLPGTHINAIEEINRFLLSS